MIDHTRSKMFKFECPADSINRQHRYMVYFKKRFLGKFYKLDEAYRFCNDQVFDSMILSWQYLGHDGYYHTFQREYLYSRDNQLSLF